MSNRRSRVRLFEDKVVYVIDRQSALFGKKVVVDFFLADGTPAFREAQTRKPVELRIEQVSELPPPGNIKATSK